MKKLLILFVGMMLILVACNDSTEEKSIKPDEGENSNSKAEQVDANTDSEEINRKAMSKSDALYYLDEITKNYFNISYLTDNDGEDEIERLLTDGIENIDSVTEEIDDIFDLTDPLTADVKEVSIFVKNASSEYLKNKEFDTLIEASGEIGYMVGLISGNYLDEVVPVTLAKVSEDFSGVDEFEEEKTIDSKIDSENNEIYSDDVKEFVEQFNLLASLEDEVGLMEDIAPATESTDGYTQNLYSSSDYVISVNYGKEGSIQSYIVGISEDQPYQELQGNGLFAMLHVAQVLEIDLDELATEFEKSIPNHSGVYTTDDYTVSFSSGDGISQVGIIIMFMKN